MFPPKPIPKTKTFYIATGLDHAAEHNVVRDAMIREGYKITHDWTATGGSAQAQGPAAIREAALAEMRGVLTADVVIVLLPGGRGTHTELGMAIAAQRMVVVHSPNAKDLSTAPDGNTCCFYHLPGVYHAQVTDLSLLGQAVRQLHELAQPKGPTPRGEAP